MTVREPKDDKAQGFESLLTEEEKQGLSEEERMNRIAAKMQEKFKNEPRRVSVVSVSWKWFLFLTSIHAFIDAVTFHDFVYGGLCNNDGDTEKVSPKS